MSINIDLGKTLKYLDWIKEMLFLDTKAISAKKRIVKRGEVYSCSFGMGIGSEESKERPCVIIQYDSANAYSPNTIVAPITHTSSSLPVVIEVKSQNNLDGSILLDGNVLLGNITCISKARLGKYITKLNQEDMLKIDASIAISLDIKRHYDKLRNIYNDKLNYIIKLKAKVSELEAELEKRDKLLELLK